MRILFVTPWVPGVVRPRSQGFIRLLSEKHELRILSLYRKPYELEMAADLGDWQPELIRNGTPAALVRCGMALSRRRSLQAAYANVPRFRRRLHRLIAEWRPHAVHLNVSRTANLAHQLGVPGLVDLDEFRSDYYRQLAATGHGMHRLIGRYEYHAMRRDETALLRLPVQVLVSGESADPVYRAPNIHTVRTPVWSNGGPAPEPDEERIARLLFVGRLSYEANVSGILGFVRDCWPLVRERHPDLRLQIVGATPPPEVTALAGSDGIEVYPDVARVDPFYREGTIAIIPIERATGVQMKLIQALAANVPVVTTPIVAGLGGVADRTEAVVASTPEEWLDGIDELIGDAEFRNRLVAMGRLWYEANHSPASVAVQLDAAYDQLRAA